MDLVYYESPPGLQLLHCTRFDEEVQGGASTFLDCFEMAEVRRGASPHAVCTLAHTHPRPVTSSSASASPSTLRRCAVCLRRCRRSTPSGRCRSTLCTSALTLTSTHVARYSRHT